MKPTKAQQMVLEALHRGDPLYKDLVGRYRVSGRRIAANVPVNTMTALFRKGWVTTALPETGSMRMPVVLTPSGRTALASGSPGAAEEDGDG